MNSSPARRIDEIRDELVALRAGSGLAEPTRILERSDSFQNVLQRRTGVSRDDETAFITASVRVIEEAIERLSADLKEVAAIELNCSNLIYADELGQRQEDYAALTGISSKTVRRRGNRALRSLAYYLLADRSVSGEVQVPFNVRSDENPEAVAARTALRLFWRLTERATVDIVCSEIPPDERPEFADPADRNYLRYASFADLDSLVITKTCLAQLAPDASVRDFLPSEYRDTHCQHLIVIGGPPWNSKYREFQNQLPARFEEHSLGEDDPLIVGQDHYVPEWNADGTVETDVSIFARLNLKSGISVTLMGGCLTLGVQGAARCFLDGKIAARNLSFIARHVSLDDDLIVLARTARVGGIAEIPDLADGGLVSLMCRPAGKRSQFSIVTTTS